MKSRSIRAAIRSLAAALLSASLVFTPAVLPTVALAAPEAAKPDRASEEYLDQLLEEINARRAAVGSPPVAYAGPGANQAVERYLADLTPLMVAARVCFHGSYNPVAPGWDYVTAAGLKGEVRGEVIGCPGHDFYWSPQQIANGWWNSPAHFKSLYGDPEANVVACGVYGPGRGGFTTVACLTYRV